jgi:hypothetical protein
MGSGECQDESYGMFTEFYTVYHPIAEKICYNGKKQEVEI